MFDMREGSQTNKLIPLGSLGANYFQPRIYLLSVLVRRYGQNKTMYILYVSLWDHTMAHVQNSIAGSYMDAVFELVVHEESEILMSLPHSSTKEDLLQLPG